MKKRTPSYTMLGREVHHNSPAYLTRIIPPPVDFEREHAAAAATAAEALKPKEQTAESVKSAAKGGVALGKLFADEKVGTATQSAGYQSYRRGEREDYS